MANEHPVVLVHGVLGFGPHELGPLAYWGSALKVASPLEWYNCSIELTIKRRGSYDADSLHRAGRMSLLSYGAG